MNCKVDIMNNIITENSCYGTRKGAGGGISVGFYGTGDPSLMGANIINNTIINNYAQHKGNGIYVNKIDVEITNSIIRDNDGSVSSQIVIEGIGYHGCEYMTRGRSSYCLLTENESPCIDAGNPDNIYNDVLDGLNVLYPALGDNRNDMGAFGGPHSKWWQDDMHLWDSTLVSVDNGIVAIPNKYSLSQNYPNPFNPSTTIKYGLPKDDKREMRNVKVVVFDLLGREVVTLVNEKQKAGYYEVNWDASNFTSGVYFYTLRTGDFVRTKKMILIK